ncbi:TonB-dependent receptor domain-containing protein [Chitinophaga nivalis]|uniref:TonB-dependent receptor n=1 Tax=Chitinophaga nivalis TaxID=2991709 RepID=A0ABT3II71_9BACT|nr:TonB-dependent receptor [Chitinophaga nivalis]MCW3466850.1 TonB-dependent receptor [Chitinophaga nivalis]MCW3483459.1 TonB-dependent receptor [Chitinophaga nivalis]
MKKFIVVLGMLCHALTTLAQHAALSGTITIQVTDNGGKPLPFANLLLRQVKDSTLVKGELTTETGQGRFENITAGHYFIQASQMGYTTTYSTAFQVDATHTRIDLKSLQLPTLAKNLQAVNVTATKPYIEKSAGKTVLNVEGSVTAAGNTALDILRRAPGVQIDNSENVKIKGQTVTVMIDGKQTYLSGEDLANLLKNTSGETIAQIEILTSPSAKYDAAGNGGIINIKTKKGKLTGINGAVNVTLSQAKYGFYRAGGNFNWRTSSFNLFGDFNKGDRPFMVTRDYSRQATNDKGITTALQQDVLQRNRFQNNSYKAGLDFFINEKHTIGILVNGYINSFNNRTSSDTYLGQPQQVPDSILGSFSRNHNRFNNTAFNLNYKAVLDTSGKEFSIDADYARFNSDRNLLLNDSMYDTRAKRHHSFNGIQNNGNTQVTIKSVKADLAWPLGKEGKLEAGLKYSSVGTSNVLLYDSLQNGSYKPAPSQSNEFNYTEDVYAAYASYKKQLGKTGIQMGLRLENTKSDGYSVTTNTHVKRSYLDFFPNLNVEQKLNDKNKIALAYNRRIERPEYGQLNPFMFYLDRYTYFRGNPYLNPQYNNNFELSYTFMDKYIATLSYNRTNNIIEEFIAQDNNTKASISTMENFDNANFYGLILTIPFQVTKWWATDNNIDLALNNYRFSDPGNPNIRYNSNGFAYDFTSTNTFTLPHDMKLEIMGYYHSPFMYGIFRGVERYNMNAGIQKTILKKAGTIKLSVNNILRNEFYRGAAEYTNMHMNIFNTWQFRTYSLYFTYRFGNTNIKAARDRKTATSDEQKRAG